MTQRTKADLDATKEMKVQRAKTALCRMKAVAKTLVHITISLEEASTVQSVTNQSSSIIRTVGLSSLRDVLGRIFEIHKNSHWHLFAYGTASVGVSKVLSHVYRRFRIIAFRLPSLWEDVSNCQGKD